MNDTAHPHDPTEEEIQKEAHLLWLEQGRPVGRDLDIWLAAKELLRHRHAHAGADPRTQQVQRMHFPPGQPAADVRTAGGARPRGGAARGSKAPRA